MAEDGNKKRKRETNGLPKANKKAAIQSNAEKIKITHINADGLHPVIVSSNSIKSPSLSFDAYSKTSRGSTNGGSANPASHDILLHSSKHPRLDYVATPPSAKLAHYIAAYDPRTNSIKILPAHHAQLQATLRVEPPAPDTTPRKTLGQQRIALGQEFGTKKAKKIIAARAQNAITNSAAGSKEEEVQNAILASIAESAPEVVSETDDLAARVAGKPIPQPNLAAETVEDIYPLHVLVPPSDMKLIPISDWQEQRKDVKGVQGWNRMPMHRVERIIDDGDITKLKALRYAALLLQFNDALAHAGRGGSKVPKKEVLQNKLSEYPENLIDSVRKRFSGEDNTLNKFRLERLHTHICALSLYVDDYATDISHLRDDLKLEPKTIQNYFSELGCKLRPMNEKEKLAKERANKGQPLNKAFAASIKIAVLKCPPDFPRPKFIRRK